MNTHWQERDRGCDHPATSTRARGADGGRERGDVVRAVVTTAVDEERRRAGDAAEVGAVDVVGDARGADAVAKIVREALDVKPEPLCV